ncbi:MAG: M1 family aminopeptidase [Vicinamibacterales bacterium]
MRSFLDVLIFELRLQLRSPLFAGMALLYGFLHLVTIAQTGIHLTDNPLIALNSPYLQARTALVLGILNPLPAIAFVAYALTRDHERQTAEAFYTVPISSAAFLLGRFTGGLLCVLLIGAVGVAGMMAGAAAPWVASSSVLPFAWTPIIATFGLIVVPNLLVYSAFSFAVAAFSRSLTAAFIVAPAITVLALVVNNLAVNSAPGTTPAWHALLDPAGLLALEAHVRLWSVSELNGRLPFAALAANRAIWVALSLAVLALAVARARLDVAAPRSRRAAGTRPTWGLPSSRNRSWGPASAGPFLAQLRMDLRAIFLSPFSAVVALLAVIGAVSEAIGAPGLSLSVPQRPLTALLLGFFRYGLLQFVLMLIVFFAGTLVHRERDHRLSDILGACPYPDWLMVVSKTLALGLAVTSLQAIAMVAIVARQLVAGHHPLNLRVYAEALLLNDGVYFWMLTVLAVVIQVLTPGKWSGMVITVAVYALLLALPDLGFEDLLYGFRIPFVVYTDINGFGHYRLPTISLAAYWSACCALLLMAAHLLYPRGPVVSLSQRLAAARWRVTRPLVVSAGAAGVLFAAFGAWIFYNTHILNAYSTVESRLARQAEYERRFSRYRNQPGPSLSSIDLAIDLFPDERRLVTRGRAQLRNNRASELREVIVSADPRIRFTALSVAGATLTEQDAALGFYRFALAAPQSPGSTWLLEWEGARVNPGFVNSGDDTDIVANGTYVELRGLMPIPAYDDDRDLRDAAARQRLGLPAAPRLPALGDPAWLNTVGLGVDGRADLHLVVSTSGDQLAISSGRLVREWRTDGRHHFEYTTELPVWPTMPLVSSRFAVSRDTWDGVSLEVYHHPDHTWNVPVMLDTAKKALGYFSREFAPYPLTSFRIMEYPRYRSAAQAMPGSVAYSEAAGFHADLTSWATLDYATIHEAAHQWWGGYAYGARMQGRQMLNETLAQYSTLMVYREYEDPRWLRELLATTLNNYLDGRSRESIPEQPLIRTEDQGNISYNKGALVMFALQDLIGADKVHAALRAYLARFGMKPPPFPMSTDLVDELRAVTPAEHQALITDLFEKISFYDVRVDRAEARQAGSGYEVAIDITARQLEADGQGVEHEVPLDTWFDVAVFPASDLPRAQQTPLYKAKHRLTSGTQRIVVHVPQRPGAAGVDPYHLMVDRTPADNVKPVVAAPAQ